MVENLDLDDELIKSILNEYKVRNVDICIKYIPTTTLTPTPTLTQTPTPTPIGANVLMMISLIFVKVTGSTSPVYIL